MLETWVRYLLRCESKLTFQPSARFPAPIPDCTACRYPHHSGFPVHLTIPKEPVVIESAKTEVAVLPPAQPTNRWGEVLVILKIALGAVLGYATARFLRVVGV